VAAFRECIRELVQVIEPLDAVESRHQAECLAWIESGAPLCRTVKPATPPEHLVAFAVAVDPLRSMVFLVDHRIAGLWLPTGGHVEPGEHPMDAARRELREELGIDAPRLAGVDAPLMVTRTVTVGRDAGHMDVDLWYGFEVDLLSELVPDPAEFIDARWWSFDDVRHDVGSRFDPHLPRFIVKARALIGRPESI
jgi:8-oxo-dGTP diphosphatase